MFHLYLPANAHGQWRPVALESHDQLSSLKRSFSTPRIAVAHILDQFPISRRREEKDFNSFRTKNRILKVYDSMSETQQSGRPFVSCLHPPPGTRRQEVAVPV
jgi:hypothetical protein